MQVKAIYSTPATYARARLSSAVKLHPVTSDFFPYFDGDNRCGLPAPDTVGGWVSVCVECVYHLRSGWSGYFTSRAALKGYIRETTMWQTVARQLGALARDGTAVSQLLQLEQAMGLGQHHDAVTGTAKQAVTWDLQKRVRQR